MNKKKLVQAVAIPLFALLLFWVGGFLYFKNSEDWKEIRTIVANSSSVREQVGTVSHVSVSLFPFSYKFSGEWARARLSMTIKGAKGELELTQQFEKKNGRWEIAS